PSSWFRPWRPPSAALLSRIARRPWNFRPDVAAMTMLPAGRVDVSERPAPLPAAVLASCAIPAYFAPVAIGGVEYFDGGVHSPNNADVLRRRPPEVVVVISPMSAARFPSRRADALVRWSAH